MDSKDTNLIIEDESSKESNRLEVNILCLNLTNKSTLVQFLVAAGAVFAFHLANGYYVELMFASPEFKDVNVYITLVQFMLTTAFSFAETLFGSKIQRKTPLKTYALLATLTLGTMAFSNFSLVYINYPTLLIFKSCVLIPVMIGSIVILGKRYEFLDYVAAVIMCAGLTMFSLADSQASPNLNATGVTIVMLALVCDSIIGNVQEKVMRQYQASNNEVVLYSYGIASVYLFIFTAATGTLIDGFEHCYKDPVPIYSNIVMLSLTGYVGLQAVLTLVRVCGAPIAVTVTTMRKTLSIILSFLIFSKPFVMQYVWSLMLVILAIYVNLYSQKHPSYVPSYLKYCCCKRPVSVQI